MKLVHKGMVAASVVMLVGTGAMRANAADFTFTQVGWQDRSSSITENILFGSFSGTPGANGEIGLSDLTNFRADFSLPFVSSGDANWGLSNLSSFSFNPRSGLLNLNANKIITVVNSFPPPQPFTVTTVTNYGIQVNSNSPVPGNYSVNLSFFVSIGGGGSATIFSFRTLERPRIFPPSITRTPESSNTIGLLATMGVCTWLVTKKSLKAVKTL